MFARVSQVQYPPQHDDAGLRVVVEELLPALRRVPGCRGCCLLADGKPGNGLGIVFWETEHAADAASTSADVAAARVKLAALGLTFASRQIYDVVACDRW